MALVRRKRSNEAATAIGDWEGMDGVGGGDDGSDQRGVGGVHDVHCGFASSNIMRTPGLSSKRRRWRDGARSRPVDGGRLTSSDGAWVGALGASVGVGSGTAPLPCGCLRPPTRQVLRGLRIDHSECSDVKVNWTPTGGLAVAAAEATALPDMTNAERLRIRGKDKEGCNGEHNC
uniref:Uncharacterized protein n=1 Tax=Oryza glumipatula TaxID=40148 RepID=A0A0E0AKP2_9ORYZ